MLECVPPPVDVVNTYHRTSGDIEDFMVMWDILGVRIKIYPKEIQITVREFYSILFLSGCSFDEKRNHAISNEEEMMSLKIGVDIILCFAKLVRFELSNITFEKDVDDIDWSILTRIPKYYNLTFTIRIMEK